MIFQIFIYTCIFCFRLVQQSTIKNADFSSAVEVVSLSNFAAFSDLNSSSDIFKLENPCRQILLKLHDTAENV